MPGMGWRRRAVLCGDPCQRGDQGRRHRCRAARASIDMHEHVFAGRDLGAILAQDTVMQADAFGVMAQKPGLGLQKFAGADLGQMADMRLDRIGRAAGGAVIRPQPGMDALSSDVGRAAPHQQYR